jgi:hypothetical protein
MVMHNVIWRNRRRIRLLSVAAMLLAILPLLVTRPAAAGTLCARGDCLLACDTRLRQCSMYSERELTPRLTIVEFMPYGYRRVYSTSACERRVCTRRNASCDVYP